MKKEEKVKLFIDAFPDIYDALEEYANGQGYVGISRYIRREIEQAIDFVEENFTIIVNR